MAEKEKQEKVTLTSFDPVETPEEVIDHDKNIERKEEFREANKRIAKIIPEYFLSQRKKRKTGSNDESAFSQELKVTPENATIAVHATTRTKGTTGGKEKNEKKEAEIKEKEEEQK